MNPNDLVVTRRGLRFQGRYIPCTVGHGGGVEDKREGDGGTPIGIHNVVGCMYRPDRMARPTDWAEPILPGDLWSDDSHDPDYNSLTRTPHSFSHETLRRADPLYDLVLITDWNWPVAIPGKGSAIFIHSWRKPGHPTEGCVAMAPAGLMWIVQNIKPGTRLIMR